MYFPIYHIAIAVIGLAGFCICLYIASTKKKQKPLICPLRGSCDFVTTSDYAKVFGIHLEYIGISYYCLVTLFHILMVLRPQIASFHLLVAATVASACAFLFSLYLTGIQAFVLKKWCTWCVCSAVLCALIFIASYLSLQGPSIIGMVPLG